MKSLPVVLVSTSAVLTALLTWWLLPLLKKMKGETVREDVPERHRSKAGTPTMGGVAFVIAVPLTTIFVSYLWLPSLLVDALIFSGAMLSYALLGFADDWAKLTKRKGWRTQPKLAAQTVLAVLWIWLVSSRLNLRPPFQLPYPIVKWLWFAFLLVLFLATVNGVNIADGLDGLASGLTAIASFAIGLIAWRSGFVVGAVMAFALCGGCLGFLVFNRYPAKVFMGDVGSMALGAGLATSVIMSRFVLPFLLIGLVFWIEQATVILQVAYFKWTKKRYGEGKRIFPMTPIHHSFELLGWREPIIVAAFWLSGVIFAALGVGASLILSRW